MADKGGSGKGGKGGGEKKGAGGLPSKQPGKPSGGGRDNLPPKK